MSDRKIKVGDKSFILSDIGYQGYTYRGAYRDTALITVKDTTYADVLAAFVDNVSIAEEKGNGTTDTDYSIYAIAGAVSDNRNGTFTVRMGKRTEAETYQVKLEDAQAQVAALEEENAELLFQNLTGEEFEA